MPCKGICIRYKAIKNGAKHRYKNGQKRCSVCCLFIKWEGIKCPCCKTTLRLVAKQSATRKLKTMKITRTE